MGKKIAIFVRTLIGYHQQIFISQDNNHKCFCASGMQTRLEAPLVWHIAENWKQPLFKQTVHLLEMQM